MKTMNDEHEHGKALPEHRAPESQVPLYADMRCPECGQMMTSHVIETRHASGSCDESFTGPEMRLRVGPFPKHCTRCAFGSCEKHMTQQRTGHPEVKDESRYEPDRAKRCQAILRAVGSEAFAVCNRTAGHPDEHERWSYTGIRIDVWPADPCPPEAQVIAVDSRWPRCPNCGDVGGRHTDWCKGQRPACDACGEKPNKHDRIRHAADCPKRVPPCPTQAVVRQCPAILEDSERSHHLCLLDEGHGGEHEGSGEYDRFKWDDTHPRAAYCGPPKPCPTNPRPKDVGPCESCESAPPSKWCNECIVEDYEGAHGITMGERESQLHEALHGLVQNIKMHHDKSCPGITPSDCLDAIYEAANVALAVLEAGARSETARPDAVAAIRKFIDVQDHWLQVGDEFADGQTPQVPADWKEAYDGLRAVLTGGTDR